MTKNDGEMITIERLLREMRYGLDNIEAWDKSSAGRPDWLERTIAFNEFLLSKARIRYTINPTQENLEWGKSLRRFLDELRG